MPCLLVFFTECFTWINIIFNYVIVILIDLYNLIFVSGF